MRPPLDGASRLARAIGIATVVAVLAPGCDDRKAATVGADATASAPTDASVAVAVPVPDSGLPLPLPLPICRIMASENGPPAKADATGWLDLVAHASFTVRTLETGRELRFEGPGRVRACGDDVALVAEGSAIGLPGSGEAPGAEQWVATACGVGRWASGVHRFTGARDACKLQSSLGAVQLYVASDVTVSEVAADGGAPLATDAGAVTDAGRAKASPWRRIDGRRAFTLQPRSAIDGAAGVKTALVACERAADAVQKMAAAMLPDARADGGAIDGGGAGIGDLAEESVVARGVARAACAVAAVRVALAGSRPIDEGRLTAAMMRWRGGR
ncbi:MAG: hypothetical protein QOI41_1569 [Myxococcales bacterium]|nr:hypothetical protein [Myxococcales bacterium]